MSLATPLKLILLHIAVSTLSRRFQTVLGLKEVMTPMSPLLSVQELDWAFAQRTPNKGGWSSKMTPPTGKTTPEGAAAIAVSMTGGQYFRPEHPDPRHSTCPAWNTH